MRVPRTQEEWDALPEATRRELAERLPRGIASYYSGNEDAHYVAHVKVRCPPSEVFCVVEAVNSWQVWKRVGGPSHADVRWELGWTIDKRDVDFADAVAGALAMLGDGEELLLQLEEAKKKKWRKRCGKREQG